jgi:predicted negative regulator of RcsB-dependent stress response
VDRLTRKELKQDKFAREVGHTVEFLGAHKKQVARYGTIGLAVVVAIAGFFYFNKRQHAARERDLTAAMQLMTAPVGAGLAPGVTSFATTEERSAAVVKALADLSVKHSSSQQGTIASYLLGTRAADQGKFDEAVKHLSEAAGSGQREYAALAQLALAEVYAVQGKTAEGEKLLRGLVSKPTILVSSEQATLVLAQLLAPTRPEEARKLLEPLRDKPGASGRAAITALGEMSERK